MSEYNVENAGLRWRLRDAAVWHSIGIVVLTRAPRNFLCRAGITGGASSEPAPSKCRLEGVGKANKRHVFTWEIYRGISAEAW